MAEEKYELLVYPIVFYLLSPEREQVLPDHYHSEVLGLVAHQDYVVIKAWELSAEEVVAEENLALLPFVGLMAGADEGGIRRSVAHLRRLPEENLALLPFVGLMAGADEGGSGAVWPICAVCRRGGPVGDGLGLICQFCLGCRADTTDVISLHPLSHI